MEESGKAVLDELRPKTTFGRFFDSGAALLGPDQFETLCFFIKHGCNFDVS